MELKDAKIVKMVDNKWGFAIFTQDYEGNPTKPTLKLLEKQVTVKKGVSKPWYQMCGGWYCETLMENYRPGRALAIDCGQNWVCPSESYGKIQEAMKSWLELNELPDVDPSYEVW